MTPPRIERRLTAIMAVDVAGYSRLMGIDEVDEPEETMRKSRGNQPVSSASLTAPTKGGATRRDLLLGSSALAAALSLSKPALAQNSPSSGPEILPAPEPKFRGVIGRKASESKPDFPEAVK